MMKALFAFLLLAFALQAQPFKSNPYRNVLVMNGNDITVSVYNYGSYSNAGNHTTDFQWHGLGYAYECGFFFGAEVPVPKGSHPDVFEVVNGDSIQYFAHVISDGFTSNGPEMNPDLTMHWGLNPIRFNYDSSTVYLDPAHFDHLPHYPAQDFNRNGVPDLWPEDWFDPSANAFEWPGIWQNGQPIGDLETIYGMDDRDNKEFAYYPFPQDSSRQGLGIEVEVHPIQVQDFYQDILFSVITLHNVSAYDLKKMIFGFASDPHIGGWSDYADDHFGYDQSENLIYFYDTDNKSMVPGVSPGYFGIVFLQTPGNSRDGIDNDGDGMIDESQWDGIDNDGDWNAETDDLGADGIANTGDYGEGDGQPTLGEPNFEYTDMDEADMVGMTSADYVSFGSLYMRDDEKLWQKNKPGLFDGMDKEGDRLGLAGCGYFNLPAGRTVQIGVAIVFGNDLDDLLANVHRAKRLYQARMGNYKLTKSLVLTDTLSGKTFVGQIPLKWNPADLPADALLECAVSDDGGQHWQQVAENIGNTGSVNVDVSSFSSKPFYQMRLRAFSKEAYFQYQTDGYFAIDNSGSENVPPDLLVHLKDNDILSEKTLITYRIADVDGDPLKTFLIIRSNVVNDTLTLRGDSLWLYTRNFPNGSYQFLFTANDGQSTTTVTREVFIQNDYDMADSTLLQHIQGFATGKIGVQLVNSMEFKYHLYKVTFSCDSRNTYYSVEDSTIGRVLINNDLLPQNGDAWQTFNGFRLSFKNDKASLNKKKTGWNPNAKTNLNFNLQVVDKIYPFDIELHFYNHIVDTSIILNTPLSFTADNLTKGEKAGIYVFDSTGWEPEDKFFLTASKTDWTKLWLIQGEFSENTDPINPAPGDVFTIRTFKPFTDQDVYLFDATPLTALAKNQPLPNQFVLQQNFPNPFNPQTTIRFSLARSGKVKLAVFNVLGQKVKTLIDGSMQSGEHQIVFDGSRLASGIYWYRLQANGKVKTRKMILLK